MSKFTLLSLLNADNFGFFNRELGHLIGLEPSILFCDLVSQHERQKNHSIELLGEDGWFPYSIEDAEQNTCLTRKLQDGAIRKLVEEEWIKKTTSGLPNKRYFKINEEKIYELITVQKKITKLSQRDKLECPNGTNCDVPTGQTDIYSKNIKEKKSNVPDPSDAETTGAETSSEASKMARYLLMKRDKHFPKMKQPRIDGWIKDLDLMNRIDGRSWDEIKAAIDFAMEDAFWCKNILSAEKLRAQYDKLYAKMTPVKNSGTQIEKNREIAIEVKNYLLSSGDKCDLQIFKEKVFIPFKNETLYFNMNSQEFENILMKMYGLKKS